MKFLKQLNKHPDSGQIEPNLQVFQQNHRYLVCGNYKIVYKVFEHQIIINDVFDTRQNPYKIAKGILKTYMKTTPVLFSLSNIVRLLC
jgi:hypothetical protein